MLARNPESGLHTKIELYRIKDSSFDLLSSKTLKEPLYSLRDCYFQVGLNRAYFSNTQFVQLNADCTKIKESVLLPYESVESAQISKKINFYQQYFTKFVKNNNPTDINSRPLLWSPSKQSLVEYDVRTCLMLAWLNTDPRSTIRIKKIFDIRRYLNEPSKQDRKISGSNSRSRQDSWGSGEFHEFDFLQDPKKSSQFKLFMNISEERCAIQFSLFSPKTRKMLKRQIITKKQLHQSAGVNIKDLYPRWNRLRFDKPIYCQTTRSIYFALNPSYKNEQQRIQSAIMGISDIFGSGTSVIRYPPVGDSLWNSMVVGLGFFDSSRLYYALADSGRECRLIDRGFFDQHDRPLSQNGPKGVSSGATLDLGSRYIFEKIKTQSIDDEREVILYEGELSLTLYNRKIKRRVSQLDFEPSIKWDNSTYMGDIYVSWEKDHEFHTFYKALPGHKLEKINEFYLSEILGRELKTTSCMFYAFLQEDFENSGQFIFFTEVVDAYETYQDTLRLKRYYASLSLDKHLNVIGHRVKEKIREEVDSEYRVGYSIRGANLVIHYLNQLNPGDNNTPFYLIDTKTCSLVDRIELGLNNFQNFISRDTFCQNKLIIISRLPKEGSDTLDSYEYLLENDLVLRKVGFSILTVNTEAKKLEYEKKSFTIDLKEFDKRLHLSDAHNSGFFFAFRDFQEDLVQLLFYDADNDCIGKKVLMEEEVLVDVYWNQFGSNRMVAEDLLMLQNEHLVDLKERAIIPLTKFRCEN